MKKVVPFLSLAVAITLLFALIGTTSGSARSQNIGDRAAATNFGSSFTYQGYLTQGDEAANGPFDFRFSLYGLDSGGTVVSPDVIIEDVDVVEGLFTVLLDFGQLAFDGDPRWLEIAVRPGNETGDYTTLNPRQALTATPYALHAAGAEWTGLVGVPAGFADGVDNDSLAQVGCDNGQIVEWNGSAWVCGDDDVGAGGGGGDISGNN